MTKAHHKQLISRAQTRADITAFLSQNPGQHSAAAVADALGRQHSTIGQHLMRMAKDGLIGIVASGKRRLFTQNFLPDADVTASAEPKPRKQRIVATRDVEIVTSGYQIVLGKNEQTGRLRIVIDQIG
jgi:DNA-binding transcriptional ArsR family regulator